MEHKHQKILLTSMLFIYAFIMIIGAALPNPSNVPLFSGNSTFFHFFGFLVLSAMIFRTLQLYNIKHKTFFGFFLILGFILFTEFLQIFVSTRSFSYADMAVDLVGALLGWGLYSWIYSKR